MSSTSAEIPDPAPVGDRDGAPDPDPDGASAPAHVDNGPAVSRREFDALFDVVRTWGRWDRPDRGLPRRRLPRQGRHPSGRAVAHRLPGAALRRPGGPRGRRRRGRPLRHGGGARPPRHDEGAARPPRRPRRPLAGAGTSGAGRGDVLAAEKALGVAIGEGDAVLLRSGQVRRRAELGAWDPDTASAGFHVDAVPFWPNAVSPCSAGTATATYGPRP